MKAQENQYNQKVETLRNEHENQQTIAIEEDLQRAQEFESNETQKLDQVAQDNLKSIGNAGFEGAKCGAVAGLVGAAVMNGAEVLNGKKTVSKAILDTGKTGGMAALVGGGVSTTLSTINTFGLSSTNQTISQVSSSVLKNSTWIIPVLFAVPKIHEEIELYWKQQKSGVECCKNLMGFATTTLVGMAGGTATIALVSLLFPGIGSVVAAGVSAVGGVMATMASNRLFELYSDILKPNPQDTLQEALLWFGLSHETKYNVNERYKTLRKIYHPDSGGTNESFVRLQTYYSVIVASVNSK